MGEKQVEITVQDLPLDHETRIKRLLEEAFESCRHIVRVSKEDKRSVALFIEYKCYRHDLHWTYAQAVKEVASYQKELAEEEYFGHQNRKEFTETKKRLWRSSVVRDTLFSELQYRLEMTELCLTHIESLRKKSITFPRGARRKILVRPSEEKLGYLGFDSVSVTKRIRRVKPKPKILKRKRKMSKNLVIDERSELEQFLNMDTFEINFKI